LAVLSAVSLSLLWSGNTSYRLARNGLGAAEVNSTVEAAVNRAALALLDPQVERRWRTDGLVQSFDFNGNRVNVSIQDELGRIDLNQAGPSLLTGLAQSVGLEYQVAANLTDKILDWRSAESLKHLNGAKDADYRARESNYRPRNGPFQSVDELQLVMDVTPTLFKKLKPALTVYSGRQFVDPAAAPREVLLALPNMNPDNVNAAMNARSVGEESIGRSIDITQLRGRAFTVRTEFEKLNTKITQEVAIRLTASPGQPFWVLNWRVN
jgi:general secretion pathway protein K